MLNNLSDRPGNIPLAYAQNRDRNPAYLAPGEINDPLAMRHFFDPITGKPLSGDASYITVADGHSVLFLLCLLTKAFKASYGEVPYIAIVGKHANPCGAAFDWKSTETALSKALLGNPVAAMGGELISNFPINNKLAHQAFLRSEAGDKKEYWGLDLLIAPGFSDDAVQLLGKKAKRRLLVNVALTKPTMPTHEETIQVLRGGDLLVEQAQSFVLTPESFTSFTGNNTIPRSQFENMILAWAVAWCAYSNTADLVKDNMLIGLGCGQQDRIECVRLAIDRAIRAGHDPQGSVFASDAFFPFATGELASVKEISDFAHWSKYNLRYPSTFNSTTSRDAIKRLDLIIQELRKFDKREAAELLIDAGCIGGVVPGDGNNLEAVRALFENAGLSVAFLAPEHRGFSKH